jgi:large subunit ribosomal protein L25
MEVGNLNAKVRPTNGTGEARKLRQAGMIPAICYGAGQDAVQISISPSELQKALDPKKGRNTLLKLHIEGQSSPESVLLKDAQHTKLRGDLVHADFLRVKLDKPVRATVPLVLTGKSEGVKAGGIMHQVYRRLDLLALPERIPEHIEIDVTNLGMGQSIHVSDLKLPEGTKAAIAGNTTLCVVTAPKAEKAAEGAAAEGAAAEGAEGAAASAKTPAPDAKAGGDKGGDKAAAKPAAGGKK